MQRIKSDDAEIAYSISGDGPPVVLLHPFPAHHALWTPAAQALIARYRVILPDLRGHGESGAGEGPATMGKHASDIERILNDAGVGRAVFAGVSIGGYILFECWRRFRGRFAGLVLCDTRPQPDTPEARSNRLRSAADVLERGIEPFLDGLIPKLFGRTTLGARPDRVDEARRMMLQMSPQDIAQVLEGMAERPDSLPTLRTINVPAMIVMGEEDTLSTVADGELMRANISGSQLRLVPKAGHYAPWEQPEEVGRLLRQFVDSLHRG
jgi:pimeloyl-ACP methyl ester carboxylesterase